MRRTLLSAGVLVIAGGAAAASGVAYAGSPYTVTVKVVPSTTPIPGSFTVRASGLSLNLSLLKVYLNTIKPCAPTAAGDAAIAGDVLVIDPAAGVVESYLKTKSFSTIKGATGPRGEGNHVACAYLISAPPAHLLRAHSGTAYSVG